MPSQLPGTPDRPVTAQYSHFLQMWEFLEDTGGFQDGNFIVVQAPGVGSREKSSGDSCERPGTNPTQHWQCSGCRREEEVLTAQLWTAGCAPGSW